ncbi:hypothetical protein HOA92_05990 [archaeon]|jgi:Kef-type K+ transport system membrane component KefB|nr:hypothetical protein [archaeon]MBT6762562.1 hypothetical protein [archaeon]
MAVASNIFVELGIIVILAGFLALLFRWARQPQLLAYIFVGVLITPILGIITSSSVIDAMSTIGIAFLLFIVGLEMDLKKLKTVAFISSVGGTVQIAILFTTSFLIAMLLGFIPLEAMYIGLMLAFSSTMIVMKFLSDRRELSTLHGRIVVGILLMEDLFAIFALSILTTIGDFTPSILVLALLKFVALIAAAYFATKFIFPTLFRFAARAQELLLVASLAICFLFSLSFHYLGFSVAIGAFAAGLTLGNLRYNLEIIARVRSLRDFFSLLFFVSLGMGLSLGVVQTYWKELIVFSLFIILFKPLIVLTLCTVFRYTKKPAFYSALYLTQIGEFALIIAAQGKLLGHLSSDIFSMVVLVALITITTTSYFVKYNSQIFAFVEPYLTFLDRYNTEGLEFLPQDHKPKIVLCGHNRIGYSILRKLKRNKKNILVVDYNPEIIASTARRGFHCIYGEVDDEEIIRKMNLRGIKLLISTIPGLRENLILIKRTRAVNKKARIIATAASTDDALELYKAGADYVTLPHFLGGEHIANIVTGVRKKVINLSEEKERHLHELRLRKKRGHDHPMQFG